MSALATAAQRAHDALGNPAPPLVAFAEEAAHLEAADPDALRELLARQVHETTLAMHPESRATTASVMEADRWARQVPAEKVLPLTLAFRAFADELTTNAPTKRQRRILRAAHARLMGALRSLCGHGRS